MEMRTETQLYAFYLIRRIYLIFRCGTARGPFPTIGGTANIRNATTERRGDRSVRLVKIPNIRNSAPIRG